MSNVTEKNAIKKSIEKCIVSTYKIFGDNTSLRSKDKNKEQPNLKLEIDLNLISKLDFQ